MLFRTGTTYLDGVGGSAEKYTRREKITINSQANLTDIHPGQTFLAEVNKKYRKTSVIGICNFFFFFAQTI